jgi:4-hydroxy-4-methyl-2-oxoglutarate aldolase
MLDERTATALARWNTPTIYNGLEAITQTERTALRMNRAPVQDVVPAVATMVGVAVTVVIEPSNPRWPREHPDAARAYRAYLASIPGPKVVVVQDLDGVAVGSFWGEVNGNVHRALGCVGTITDGAIRDVDEVRALGFKALARTLCVGHAYATPVAWGVSVQVFGCEIHPGEVIHADQHGFLVIPPQDLPGVVEAAAFLDAAERSTLIAAAAAERDPRAALARIDAAEVEFRALVARKFGRGGEF